MHEYTTKGDSIMGKTTQQYKAIGKNVLTIQSK